MLRTILVVAASLGAALLIPPVTAQTDASKLGVQLKGEVSREAMPHFWVSNPVISQQLYMAEVPVRLEKGKSVTVSVTVLGKGRTVIAELQDPKGTKIAGSRGREVKTTRFTMEELNVTGEFKILIGSDQIGDYTLTITGPAFQQLDVRTLEDRLKLLNKEVSDLEEKIKKLKEMK